jgi:hypothetical protein
MERLAEKRTRARGKEEIEAALALGRVLIVTPNGVIMAAGPCPGCEAWKRKPGDRVRILMSSGEKLCDDCMAERKKLMKLWDKWLQRGVP